MSRIPPAVSPAPTCTTRNLNLSAYLRARGYTVTVEPHADPGLSVFVVTVTHPLDFFADVSAFERGTAAVEPERYNVARRSLFDEITALRRAAERV